MLLEQEPIVELKEIIDILLKYIKFILSITFLTTVFSGVMSFFFLTPVYEGKSSVILGEVSRIEGEKFQYDDVLMYQTIIKTYAEIAKSRKVIDGTYQSLNLQYPVTREKFEKSISITTQPSTQILVIQSTSPSAEDAAAIANTLRSQFMKEAFRIYPSQNLLMIDEAQVPKEEIRPRKVLNIAVAFLLGLMISVGIIFLKETLDTTIKMETEIEKYLHLPVLGMIPKHGA